MFIVLSYIFPLSSGIFLVVGDFWLSTMVVPMAQREKKKRSKPSRNFVAVQRFNRIDKRSK